MFQWAGTVAGQQENLPPVGVERSRLPVWECRVQGARNLSGWGDDEW